MILNLLNQYVKFQASCTKIYKRLRTIKADFHSMQNVARSTFCDHFLLKYKQSNATNQVDWTHFKRKWSQKYDLAIFCTEWKSAWTFLRHTTCTHCVPIFVSAKQIYMLSQNLREPLSILIKYKTTVTPKINILIF